MVMSKTAVVMLWALFFDGRGQVVDWYFDLNNDPGECNRAISETVKFHKLDRDKGTVKLVCTPFRYSSNKYAQHYFGGGADFFEDERKIGRKDEPAVILWRLGHEGGIDVLRVWKGKDTTPCTVLLATLTHELAVFDCAAYTKTPTEAYEHMIREDDKLRPTKDEEWESELEGIKDGSKHDSKN